MPYIGQQDPSGNYVWNGVAFVVAPHVNAGYGTGRNTPWADVAGQQAVAASYDPTHYGYADTRYAPGGANPESPTYVVPGTGGTPGTAPWAPQTQAPMFAAPQATPGALTAQHPPGSGGLTTSGPAALRSVANPLVDWFTTHSGTNVNAYAFGKMKKSTQDLTLAAAEAAGHDKGDVLEDIQRTLPRAVGPQRGYVAPLGSR